MGRPTPKDERRIEPGAYGAHQEILHPSTQANHCCKETQTKSKKTGARLYVKGVVAGFKGSLAKQYNHTNLIKIEGVNDTEDVKFYLGKRIMYLYRAKTEKDGSRFRTIWGKVCRAHGTSGTVRAKFKKNLPPSALGAPV